jgi:hypothetical protein
VSKKPKKQKFVFVKGQAPTEKQRFLAWPRKFQVNMLAESVCLVTDRVLIHKEYFHSAGDADHFGDVVPDGLHDVHFG